LFRKYWYVILIVVIILALAVVVQYTKDTNDVARWVFSFLKEWAVIFGAVGALLLAVIAFWTIFRERRSKLANEINIWAKNSLRLLAVAEVEATNKEMYINNMQTRLAKINGEAITLIVDAGNFSNIVYDTIIGITKKCFKAIELESTMENQDKVYNRIYKLTGNISEDLLFIMTETS